MRVKTRSHGTSDLLFIFLLGLLVVFLVLAAQFESYLHSLVIMLTGVLAATLFTLVVVPVAYSLLCRKTAVPGATARRLRKERDAKKKT